MFTAMKILNPEGNPLVGYYAVDCGGNARGEVTLGLPGGGVLVSLGLPSRANAFMAVQREQLGNWLFFREEMTMRDYLEDLAENIADTILQKEYQKGGTYEFGAEPE